VKVSNPENYGLKEERKDVRDVREKRGELDKCLLYAIDTPQPRYDGFREWQLFLATQNAEATEVFPCQYCSTPVLHTSLVRLDELSTAEETYRQEFRAGLRV